MPSCRPNKNAPTTTPKIPELRRRAIRPTGDELVAVGPGGLVGASPLCLAASADPHCATGLAAHNVIWKSLSPRSTTPSRTTGDRMHHLRAQPTRGALAAAFRELYYWDNVLGGAAPHPSDEHDLHHQGHLGELLSPARQLRQSSNGAALYYHATQRKPPCSTPMVTSTYQATKGRGPSCATLRLAWQRD
ncbi:Protein of unknown function [Gryllus bimaculatus]|nr:Protein of unknown function [Gryllus bimaculatus]